MEKYVVFEYTEKASPAYRGARFMTLDNGQVISEQSCTKVVSRDLTEAEAYKLVDATEELNIAAHLSEYPEELRNPLSDAFIANMIRNGSKKRL
jgi:hypothetical protein